MPCLIASASFPSQRACLCRVPRLIVLPGVTADLGASTLGQHFARGENVSMLGPNAAQGTQTHAAYVGITNGADPEGHYTTFDEFSVTRAIELTRTPTFTDLIPCQLPCFSPAAGSVSFPLPSHRTLIAAACHLFCDSLTAPAQKRHQHYNQTRRL
ncbi:hypothetical protein G7K_3058-t1 [Saitoella complicata NRRL Y-17804]|uniref:Uncharacterized protein n=1 Tax=Saitoella complicata (strain BCRC 22490 / CBS 7301 / JCM 7358 / NBRC 10748 / NRRL Y-17804) TaxID=698492 RepID=A0A0E9NHM5_SAICN|nr:hypothetical protein G7K_3058-t1 [Saitoella complicata NRRL Y-17804]